MKKLLQILFLVQFTFLSCNSRTEKQTELEKPTTTENLSSVNQIKVSQTEKEKEAKINTAKIKKYAQQILENKIYPSDDDETFGCMNQLFTENQKDLNFYFNVFRVIVKKSDGALSEIVGQYILNFLKSNPDFFIKQYSEFDSEEKNRFTGFMAYEFYFSEKYYKAEIDEFFTKVSNGIKSESETRILTEIEESVKKETESIINESPD